MTKSRKTSKKLKMRLRNGAKNKHFFPHPFRSLLCIRFVANPFRSWEEVRRRGTLYDLVLSYLDRPGRIWLLKNNTCKGLWVSSLPSPIKIIKAVLKKLKTWKVYAGWTTNGRMTHYDNSPSRLRWTDTFVKYPENCNWHWTF